MKRLDRRRLGTEIMLLAILLLTLFLALPFWCMLVFATHDESAIFAIPAPLWFGNQLQANYQALLAALPAFWLNVKTSLYISSATALANMLLCALSGCAFALYDFAGKRLLLKAVILALLFPAVLNMMPTAIMVSFLQWFNQPRALILPAACGSFGILFIKQYIEQAISQDMVDAARVNGCNEPQLFIHVVLPSITPALATVGLITFIGAWNNLIAPLIVLKDASLFTAPLALRSLQGVGTIPWGAICLGASLTTLPFILLLALTARWILRITYQNAEV